MWWEKEEKERLITVGEICEVLKRLAEGNAYDGSDKSGIIPWELIIEAIKNPLCLEGMSDIGAITSDILAQAMLMIEPRYAGNIIAHTSENILRKNFRLFNLCDRREHYARIEQFKGFLSRIEKAAGIMFPESCSTCKQKICLANLEITAQYGNKIAVKTILRNLINNNSDEMEEVHTLFQRILIPVLEKTAYIHFINEDARELVLYRHSRAKALLEAIEEIGYEDGIFDGPQKQIGALVTALGFVGTALRSGLRGTFFSQHVESIEENTLIGIQRAVQVMYQKIVSKTMGDNRHPLTAMLSMADMKRWNLCGEIVCTKLRNAITRGGDLE